MRLSDNINYLKGVGPARAQLYSKLGINTIYDLLHHFPRSYTDLSSPVYISQAILDEYNTICVTIERKYGVIRVRKGLDIYKATAYDESGEITIVLFNNEYLFAALKEGETYYLNGKITGNFVNREIGSPIVLKADSESKILPNYPLTDKLTNQMVRNHIKSAFSVLDTELPEVLPKWLMQKYNLCALRYALEMIHFPKNEEDIKRARYRLAFDELLNLQLGLIMLKNGSRELTGANMKNIAIDEFYSSLPFELTNAQKRAIAECCNDMCHEYPMNRLVQGDVGSGKTAVAAACCFFAHKNGFQSALMAPTEILASQHYKTLESFLNPLGVKVALLTGSLTQKQKTVLKEQIRNGEYDVVVGTHALVQDTTQFKNLGLVITDEQHRFGVKQRATLSAKGENPHTLVMSATPIPRTMALIVYGDLDISVLDELPKGRQPIETFAVLGKIRTRAYSFIKDRLEEGRQGYIVCPMIDENEMDLKSVTEYAKELEKYFLGFNIGVLHGKLKPAQKDQIMLDFKNQKIDLLVSTTVVEVGVDVPNAVIILIENAERFGLSQLHQLRGRVGRGDAKSYCILVTDNNSPECAQRLKLMTKTNDGFVISQYDLKLRGPGDFFGARQHGLPQMKVADLVNDLELLKITRQCAEHILTMDKDLSREENRLLKRSVDILFNSDNAMN